MIHRFEGGLLYDLETDECERVAIFRMTATKSGDSIPLHPHTTCIDLGITVTL